MPVKKSTRIEAVGAEEVQGTIERIAREGARKPFQAAQDTKVDEHLSRRCAVKSSRRGYP